MNKLETYVKSIPNFPKEGIIFRDVTPVFDDPEGFKLAIHELMTLCGNVEFDKVAGIEARGFALAGPLAYNKNKGCVLVRKAGKLPRETVSQTYKLEYGTASIEMHKDSIFPGQRVVIVDDLLATGGTAKAAIDLVEQLGGKVVKVIFLMELAGLKGREFLDGYDVESVITYPGK